MAKTVMVVEDDRNTNQVICEFLKDAGYRVLSVFDGEAAEAIFFENKVDLAVLDIMLPGQSGMEVLKYIRSLSDIPVIMLTALGDEYTQIKTFDLCADEYVTKPFSPPVLVRRVGALLKRSAPIDKAVIKHGDVVVDFSTHNVIKSGQPVSITAREMELLRYLAENEGRAMTRQQILDSVWGLSTASFDRTVDTHIKNIRKKLGIDCIKTVKNVGYRYEAAH